MAPPVSMVRKTTLFPSRVGVLLRVRRHGFKLPIHLGANSFYYGDEARVIPNRIEDHVEEQLVLPEIMDLATGLRRLDSRERHFKIALQRGELCAVDVSLPVLMAGSPLEIIFKVAQRI